MGGLIDLNNCVVDEEDESNDDIVVVVTSSGSASMGSVCLELWHACAGPLISLPKKGSRVVYLPQGHLEHISELPTSAFYHLPSHVFCRVVDVKLHAEAATDEVFAQVSLVPDCEIEKKFQGGGIELNGEEEEIEGGIKLRTPHMFCKTLTASDTSTHGGFSVPRRAAEDCFPPLDYSQQRPSQELVAKDLHGVEWKFRHIYRGQPRRHLLTTGWSAFVNKKQLVSGDAVLFLRGEGGELRLGIRRAVQLIGGVPSSAQYSQSLQRSTLTIVAEAVSMQSVFHIYYTPRAIPSEFIIPLCKFSRSSNMTYSMGMRFKMRFETEDAAERRCTGLITGISDIDPVRWPGSKWRCLSVRWDEDVEINRHNRVSPWEIDPSGLISGSSSSLSLSSKRSRISLPLMKPAVPAPNGAGFSDFGESPRFQKVLQGQEISGFNTPYNGIDASSHQPGETGRCFPGADSSGMATNGSVRTPPGDSDNFYKGIDFGEESIRFHKVLQGQENCAIAQYEKVPIDNRGQNIGGFGMHDKVHRSIPENGRSTVIHGFTNGQPSTPSLQVSSPSSVLTFQQAMMQLPYPCVVNAKLNQENGNGNFYGPIDGHEALVGKLPSSVPYSGDGTIQDFQYRSPLDLFKEHSGQGFHQPTPSTGTQTAIRNTVNLVPKSGCRLFGFPLTEEIHLANKGGDATTALMTSPSLTRNTTPNRQQLLLNSHHVGQDIFQSLMAVLIARLWRVERALSDPEDDF